jgi:hypothetical protein
MLTRGPQRAILPQELIDIIIGFADRSDAYAFALVSRACLFAARAHTWRSIRVTKSQKRLSQLHGYLRAIPYLARYVRTVKVVGSFLGSHIEWPLTVRDVVVDLAPRLPKLSELSIDNLDHSHGIVGVDQAFLTCSPALRSIRALSFVRCDFGSQYLFPNSLCGLPQLLSLTLDRVSLPLPLPLARGGDRRPSQSLLRLEHLRVSSCPLLATQPFLLWLLQSETKRTMRRVQCLLLSIQGWNLLARLTDQFTNLDFRELSLEGDRPGRESKHGLRCVTSLRLNVSQNSDPFTLACERPSASNT